VGSEEDRDAEGDGGEATDEQPGALRRERAVGCELDALQLA